METKLERITQLSKRNPDMVFTSIGHLINIEMLKDCHAKMDKCLDLRTRERCFLLRYGFQPFFQFVFPHHGLNSLLMIPVFPHYHTSVS